MAKQAPWWKEIPIAMWVFMLVFVLFVGQWFYRTVNHLDIPAEAREYCDVIGMVAFSAGFARDDERLSESQHRRELMSTIGGELLDDWKLLISAAYGQPHKSPEQLEKEASSSCRWQFRHGGKSIAYDHGRVL